MPPVILKKATKKKAEYSMTPEEEQDYKESFEDERKGRLISSAELRKQLGL